MVDQSIEQGIEISDIYRLRMASDAQISPDGKRLVYVQTWLDEEADKYRSSLFLVDLEHENEKRLTTAVARDTAPRWSPDGSHIAFVSDRSEKRQLWLIAVDGGEARQLTDFVDGASSPAWSPDGLKLAFTSRASEDGEASGRDEGADSDVIHVERIRFRADGTPGFVDNRPMHIWCLTVTDGEVWQVTDGDFNDSYPAWAPSGNEIAFVSNRTEDREMNLVSEIWSTRTRGGTARCIVGGDASSFSSPVWSPDGSSLAIQGHQDPPSGSATNQNIWSVSCGTGDLVNLSESLDRSAGGSVTADFVAASDAALQWVGDSIYFTINDSGSSHLYRGKPESQPEPLVNGDRYVIDFSVSADGSRIACTIGDPLNPSDVYLFDRGGANERRLTNINEIFMQTRRLSEPESFWVESLADDQGLINGWIMKPQGFDPTKKYPLILEIHGGPHGMYGNAFVHEFQMLAARGYVVAYCNPRGSQGYGEAFTKYTRGAWGEKDMPDLMAVVDYTVAQGYIDDCRIGVTGGSYGGYMTNWLIAHSDRFKAAVTQRCVSNLYSFFGTSDIGFSFGQYEIGGLPWREREQYLRLSPISYVRDMHTPLLIVHSEQDYRCPIEQSEQLFVSLKKLDRTVEFVRIPGESHGLSRDGGPKHRTERLEHITRWFESYL